MDSAGRKVIVCDNGTGVSPTYILLVHHLVLMTPGCSPISLEILYFLSLSVIALNMMFLLFALVRQMWLCRIHLPNAYVSVNGG